jgi:hypothetical protein
MAQTDDSLSASQLRSKVCYATAQYVQPLRCCAMRAARRRLSQYAVGGNQNLYSGKLPFAVKRIVGIMIFHFGSNQFFQKDLLLFL